MEIKVIEKKDGRVKMEIDDKTFANLLNEKVWELGKSDFSAWKQEHPYTTKPEFVISAKNPKEELLRAADEIAKDADAIRKKFEKSM